MSDAEKTGGSGRSPGLWPAVLRFAVSGLVISLLAEISVSPFGTPFRFSLGPVGLQFVALFFLFPAWAVGVAAGLIVPLTHGLVSLFSGSSVDMLQAMANYAPETIAYSILGTLLHVFRVRYRSDTPIRLVFLLASADFLCNVGELLVRGEPFRLNGLATMALVALGRAAVSAGAFYVLQEGARERQWAAERREYMQRLIFTANLQTEAFFLQKSAREMEQIMAKAHRVYRDMVGHNSQPAVLEIAKDIHEVKKDYQRTLASLYRLVDMPALQPDMNLSEVAALVVDANQSYAEAQGKSIAFTVSLAADFRTPRFGRWVSILNNLVSNAVEASGPEGAIKVTSVKVGRWLILRVVDTGPGIPEEDWELVFSPGFTTKLNPVTGNFSSGIGLTHVAGLVGSMDGFIKVEKSDSRGTAFRVEVPWSALEVVGEGEE